VNAEVSVVDLATEEEGEIEVAGEIEVDGEEDAVGDVEAGEERRRRSGFL